MKRFALLVVVVAALAGAFYWVRTHYDGDASQAWASLRSSALALVSQAPKTDAAPRAAPAGGQGNQAGRPGGGGGQNPRVPVMTAVTQSANLPITRASVGWVEPIATVTVRARIEGEMVERRVQDGQMVKEGDVLFRLDDREIQAQIARDEAGLVKDQATAAKTQNDVRRVQELLGKGAASQQQFDVVTADSKVAAANVAADQAALQADRIKLGYTTMRAPISGRVGVVRVTEGNLVRANDTGDGLVTITQMQPLGPPLRCPSATSTCCAQRSPARRPRPCAPMRDKRRSRSPRADSTLSTRRWTLCPARSRPKRCSTTRTAGSAARPIRADRH